MQKTKYIRIAILVLGTILFDILFRENSAGLNVLLFSIFIGISLYSLNLKESLNLRSSILGLGAIILATAIFLHASSPAIVLIVPAILMWTISAHYNSLRSIPALLSVAFVSMTRKSIGIKVDFQLKILNSKKQKNFWRKWKIAILPIFVLPIFFVLFVAANPKFAKLSDDFFRIIAEYFYQFFENVSFSMIFYYIFGFLIMSFIVYKRNVKRLVNTEKSFVDILYRKRNKLNAENSKKGLFLGLKTEYLSSVVLVVMLNLLLVVVNVIDINWVWFSFDYDGSFNLKNFVHEGTWLLIVSIFLSMGIMLYFFRSNLNFYTQNKFLKIAVYIWIFQNVILTISVAFRNYWYISEYGLAYKRVWLIAFLIAVIIGLVTLWIKISQRKSAYYLVRVNSWAIYLILILMSFVNWDNTICRYNLSGKVNQEVDLAFLLEMSPSVYPLIEESGINLDTTISLTYSNLDARNHFERKKREFFDEEKNTSIFSYNLAERKAYLYYVNKEK